MKEVQPNKRAIELQGYLHHVDIYLDKALPRAREEDKRGNLELDYFITACGSKGCVAFHYAHESGLARTCIHSYMGIFRLDYYVLYYSLFGQMIVNPLPEFKGNIFRSENNPFGTSVVPLNVREAAMRQYRSELVTELATLNVAA